MTYSGLNCSSASIISDPISLPLSQVKVNGGDINLSLFEKVKTFITNTPPLLRNVAQNISDLTSLSHEEKGTRCKAIIDGIEAVISASKGAIGQLDDEDEKLKKKFHDGLKKAANVYQKCKTMEKEKVKIERALKCLSKEKTSLDQEKKCLEEKKVVLQGKLTKAQILDNINDLLPCGGNLLLLPFLIIKIILFGVSHTTRTNAVRRLNINKARIAEKVSREQDLSNQLAIKEKELQASKLKKEALDAKCVIIENKIKQIPLKIDALRTFYEDLSQFEFKFRLISGSSASDEVNFSYLRNQVNVIQELFERDFGSQSIVHSRKEGDDVF